MTLDRLAPDTGAPAVVSPERRLTYAELHTLSRRYAALFADLGLRRGDLAGIYQLKAPETAAAILGILSLGAAYVPIDPQAPPERVQTIAEHARIRALLSSGRHEASLAVCNLPCKIAGAATPLPEPRATGSDAELDDLAYVLYTSGSTGTPKGVAITHRQSLAFVKGATRVFELTPEDVLISHAPFNFDLSVIDLFCAFDAGASVALLPERWLAFPAKIAAYLESERVSVWNSVPSALVQLTSHGRLDRRDLSRLRLVMFAGEPYPVRHLRTLRALLPGAKLLNVYGQTEANSSTYFFVDRVPDDDGAQIPIGEHCFPGYEILLAGGEIHVRGEAVAQGYLHDPERTALAFVENPLAPGSKEIVYKTGDLAERDAAGLLYFRGRADAVVKIRGFRVELGEVEAAAGSHPAVHECAAIAFPDPEAGHRLALFATLNQAGAATAADLTAHVARLLPRYMVPETIHFEAALPKTSTGKIDRRALRSALGESTAAL